MTCPPRGTVLHRSLSARRAWIEMLSGIVHIIGHIVALRKESVDRNTITVMYNIVFVVALRKESVDRNLYYGDDLTFSDGRSPQGERG